MVNTAVFKRRRMRRRVSISNQTNSSGQSEGWSKGLAIVRHIRAAESGVHPIPLLRFLRSAPIKRPATQQPVSQGLGEKKPPPPLFSTPLSCSLTFTGPMQRRQIITASSECGVIYGRCQAAVMVAQIREGKTCQGIEVCYGAFANVWKKQ